MKELFMNIRKLHQLRTINKEIAKVEKLKRKILRQQLIIELLTDNYNKKFNENLGGRKHETSKN